LLDLIYGNLEIFAFRKHTTFALHSSAFSHAIARALKMKRKRGALEKVDADLPNLQHKIRSDPTSYQDEFLNQYSQYVQ
jgi:hypothetical protein